MIIDNPIDDYYDSEDFPLTAKLFAQFKKFEGGKVELPQEIVDNILSGSPFSCMAPEGLQQTVETILWNTDTTDSELYEYLTGKNSFGESDMNDAFRDIEYEWCSEEEEENFEEQTFNKKRKDL